jgi:hypothetical protein
MSGEFQAAANFLREKLFLVHSQQEAAFVFKVSFFAMEKRNVFPVPEIEPSPRPC